MQYNLTYSRKKACEALSCGETKLHELINTKRLRTLKLGRKTLILGDSIREFVESEAS